MGKAGSYWFSNTAGKELTSVGNDLNVSSSLWFMNGSTINIDDLWQTKIFSFWIQSISSSIEDGAKWLVNKVKGGCLITQISPPWSMDIVDFHCWPQNYTLFFPGQIQKPLPELLEEYDLPAGIFPKDATNYEFNNETKKLTVFIPHPCEVCYRDSSILRFATTVTASMEKGKLTEIQGMKTKIIVWIKVTNISADAHKIHITAGLNKARSREAYALVKNAVTVEKF